MVYRPLVGHHHAAGNDTLERLFEHGNLIFGIDHVDVQINDLLECCAINSKSYSFKRAMQVEQKQ